MARTKRQKARRSLSSIPEGLEDAIMMTTTSTASSQAAPVPTEAIKAVQDSLLASPSELCLDNSKGVLEDAMMIDAASSSTPEAVAATVVDAVAPAP